MGLIVREGDKRRVCKGDGVRNQGVRAGDNVLSIARRKLSPAEKLEGFSNLLINQ